MNNNIDPILRSDLEHIAAIFPHWEELSGKSVFITGATGLVGSMLVRTLCAAPVDITVIAMCATSRRPGPCSATCRSTTAWAT